GVERLPFRVGELSRRRPRARPRRRPPREPGISCQISLETSTRERGVHGACGRKAEEALRCVEWSIPIGHARNLPHQTTLVKVRWRTGYDAVSSETIW